MYNYRWVPQTDPSGVVHRTIDYPGVPVDHALVEEKHGILKGVRIPVRPHFGVLAVAPKEAEFVDLGAALAISAATSTIGVSGRAQRCTTRGAVPGALFSVGDPHASQGDSELCGTATKCSLTRPAFQLVLQQAQRSLPALRSPVSTTRCLETFWRLLGRARLQLLPTISSEARRHGAQSEIFR